MPCFGSLVPGGCFFKNAIAKRIVPGGGNFIKLIVGASARGYIVILGGRGPDLCTPMGKKKGKNTHTRSLGFRV